MPTTQNQTKATVLVKPLPGNIGAQLVRFLPMACTARTVVRSIGFVRFDADLGTGKGITMKSPYTLADLTPADHKTIAAWLAGVKSAAPTKRRAVASINVKPL